VYWRVGESTARQPPLDARFFHSVYSVHSVHFT
jgi:hypothetical protein